MRTLRANGLNALSWSVIIGVLRLGRDSRGAEVDVHGTPDVEHLDRRPTGDERTRMERRRRRPSAVDDNTRWDGFVPRTGDVFVCTPAKCGTTWMQSIVASLLWPTGDAPGPVLAISPWIEMKGMAPVDELYAMLGGADAPPLHEDPHTRRRYPVVRRGALRLRRPRRPRRLHVALRNHVENFQDHLRDSLNAQAAADGLPGAPAWDGDVHRSSRARLEDENLFFRHLATYWAERHRPTCCWCTTTT